MPTQENPAGQGGAEAQSTPDSGTTQDWRQQQSFVLVPVETMVAGLIAELNRKWEVLQRPQQQLIPDTIAFGDFCHIAKREAGRGNWTRVKKSRALHCGPRTVEMYMRISSNRVLRNPAYIPLLPPSPDTLYALDRFGVAQNDDHAMLERLVQQDVHTISWELARELLTYEGEVLDLLQQGESVLEWLRAQPDPEEQQEQQQREARGPLPEHLEQVPPPPSLVESRFAYLNTLHAHTVDERLAEVPALATALQTMGLPVPAALPPPPERPERSSVAEARLATSRNCSGLSSRFLTKTTSAL